VSWFRPENRLDRWFQISILIKGLDGLLEVLGGLLLLAVHPATIGSLAVTLTQHELSEDPRDFLAMHILNSGQHLATGGTTFAVAYLLIHGATKIFLVVALLRRKLWAYPVAMALIGTFIVYQVYRIGLNHSPGLVALTIFDLIVLALVWREYRQQTAPVK
jgi:uncharacterized membrane protein